MQIRSLTSYISLHVFDKKMDAGKELALQNAKIK